MAVISTFAALLSLGIFSVAKAQDIVFGDPGPSPGEGPSSEPCTTIGGPGAGQPCQFPFIYAEVTREGCITEADPEGRAWCSTKVDTEGRHVAGGEHWAHCHPGCPVSASESGGAGAGQTSEAFTVRRRCLICVVKIYNMSRWNHNCAPPNLVRRGHVDCPQLVSVRPYSFLRTMSVA